MSNAHPSNLLAKSCALYPFNDECKLHFGYEHFYVSSSIKRLLFISIHSVVVMLPKERSIKTKERSIKTKEHSIKTKERSIKTEELSIKIKECSIKTKKRSIKTKNVQ